MSTNEIPVSTIITYNRISLSIVTHGHSLMIQAHTQYGNKRSHNIMEMPYQ